MSAWPPNSQNPIRSGISEMSVNKSNPWRPDPGSDLALTCQGMVTGPLRSSCGVLHDGVGDRSFYWPSGSTIAIRGCTWSATVFEWGVLSSGIHIECQEPRFPGKILIVIYFTCQCFYCSC